jgi:FKBP-type peptidyl-prolyl cis-trans isomerase 2
VPDSYQVGPGIVVTLSYDVFNDDDELVGSENERELVFGTGELLPAIERAIDGLSPGAKRTIRVKASDAYGARDPKAIVEFDRAEFPEDVAPGDVFEAEGPTGEIVVLCVLDADAERVVIDQNHPLAGQALRVEARVLATRPATEPELERAAARLAAESQAAPDDNGKAAAPALISPDRLLRGPTRR